MDSKLTKELSDLACSTIDANSEKLNELSQEIWKYPELAYEEVYAHKILSDFLEKEGFAVTRGYTLDTAFKAEFGTDGGANIAVLCEYDALPEIGHACGHNLIAEVGVAAGLAIKAALTKATQNGALKGKVTVLGTPAEEGGGGKVRMIESGAFDGIDAAMMAHPSHINLSRPLFLALRTLRVEFHGKASHASSFPWEGVNALDAAVMAYQAVSNMRQQLKPTYRVHGIISKGGAKPNIIPDLAELSYYVRCPTSAEVDVLYDRVVACCQGAALASGCTMSRHEDCPFYKDLLSNDAMSKQFELYSDRLDLPATRDELHIKKYGGSTDMGNLSHHIPGIHPKFFIAKFPIHTRNFAEAVATPEAQVNTLKIAKSLALVALDLLLNPAFLAQAKEDFKKDIAQSKLV